MRVDEASSTTGGRGAARALRAVAAAVLTVGPIAACSGGGGGAPDAGPDAGDVRSPDASASCADLSVTVEASPQQGNAQLEVSFDAVVEGGVDPALVEFDWDVAESATYDEQSFTHTFHASTNADVTLTARCTAADGTEHTAEDSTIVRVRDAAELHFDQLSLATPLEVAPGDEASLEQGSLVNDGGEVKQPFELRIYMSSDDTLELDGDRLVDTREIDGIGSGRFEQARIDLAGSSFVVPEDVEPGNYFVFLVVDPNDVVNERREDNNRSSTTNNLTVDEGAALKPDLTVDDVGFSIDQTQPGEAVNYSFRVRNEGEGKAERFRIAAWLSEDEELDPEEDRVMTSPDDIGSTVQELEAGADQSFFKSYQIPSDLPEGNYHALVRVDARDDIVESREDNNVGLSDGPLTVEAEEQECFDLAFDELTISPTSTHWGGTLQVSATVSNPGSEPTPEGWVMRAFLSQQKALNPSQARQVAQWSLPAIEAGETVEIDEAVEGIPNDLPLLPHYAGVILDPDGELEECEEGNNAQLFPEPISIDSSAEVDLSVSGVGFEPQSVEAGNGIEVSYTLTNDGSTSATPFETVVALSEDDEVDLGSVGSGEDLVIGETVVGGVEAGGELERTDEVEVPVALPHDVESYHVAVVADPDDALSSDPVGGNVAMADEQLEVSNPQGGCFEDDREPNDTAGGAVELEPGVHEGLGSCGNDDWYRVSVPADHSLLVDLRSEPILSIDEVPADLDLELYELGPDGENTTRVDQSQRSGDLEEVERFNVSEGGDFLVRVTPATEADRASYELDVAVREPVDGIDVLPTSVSALPAKLYPGGLMEVSWVETNIGTDSAPPHDVAIWASRDTVLQPDEDVKVTELETGSIGGVAQAEWSVEVLLPLGLGGGEWRFLVELDPSGGLDEVNPDNNVGASDVVELDEQLECADDELEPNNDLGIATPLSFGNDGTLSRNELTVCPELDDWYAVELEAGEAFTAAVSYEHQDDRGLIRAELWGPSKEAVLLERSAEDTVKLDLPWVWEAGTYYVRVTNEEEGGDVGPYQYGLTASVGAGHEGSACDADAFEPNNASAEAALLGCGRQTATLCKGDVDVYRLDLQAEQELKVTMEHEQGQLDMDLLADPDSEPLATEYGNGTLTYEPTTSRTVLLRVASATDPEELESFEYSLFVEGIPGTDLRVDEVSVFPEEVAQSEDAELSYTLKNTCQNDASPTTSRFWLSKDEELDEADVSLGEASSPAVAGKSEESVTDKVTVPHSTQPGTFHVLVEADGENVVEESNEDNNVGGTPLDVIELCEPDALEPNDILLDEDPPAPMIEPPGVEGLSLCPYEVDWMAVEVPAGTTMEATLKFDQEQGDLDLRLYDPDYSTTIPEAKSVTSSAPESASYAPPDGGLVLVRVNGFHGASASYDLQITLN